MLLSKAISKGCAATGSVLGLRGSFMWHWEKSSWTLLQAQRGPSLSSPVWRHDMSNETQSAFLGLCSVIKNQVPKGSHLSQGATKICVLS